MEKETVKLLEQLAAKLGITTEYLWAALIKQAPIDSLSYLVGCSLTIGFCLWSLKAFILRFKELLKKETLSDVDSGVYVAWFFVTIFPLAIAIVILLGNFGTILSGFFNPKYWALIEVLRYIK